MPIHEKLNINIDVARKIFEKHRPWPAGEALAFSIFWALLSGTSEGQINTIGLTSVNREPVMTKINKLIGSMNTASQS